MLEQMKRAAVLLAVGAAFSPGAWSQPTLTQPVRFLRAFAAEYFGVAEGRLVEERSKENNPTMMEIVVGGAAISEGNEANLTFSLAGATFAERVSLSQFSSTDNSNVSLSLAEGGQQGDSWVTVRVAVEGGDLPIDGAIQFTVPDLQVTPVDLIPGANPPLLGVALGASVEVVRRTGDSFPEGPVARGDSAVYSQLMYTLVTAVDVTLRSDPMPIGTVSLMDRKVLTGATEAMPTGSLNLGTLTFAIISGGSTRALAEKSTNMDPLVDLASFPGDLVVTASGNFQTDDKVMLGEAELTRSEDGGSYSGSIAVEEATAGVPITYVPGGVDNLLPTTFNATVAVQYDDELNASGPVEGQQATATISYEGISLAAYAHGIVKAGGAATTYLRVACPGAADCSVFASCRDQSGGSHFGELGVVAAGGLEVYDSNEIGEALAGGWETGRGRCDLLSDGVLEVQNMLNQGSANVNNSLVTNGAGVLTKTQ